MASAVYLQFKVDIRSLVQNKVQISKGFNIGPDVIEKLPYWEYELMVEEMLRIAEEEKKGADEENDKYSNIAKGYNPNNFKQPSFKMPQMKMPSMPKM